MSSGRRPATEREREEQTAATYAALNVYAVKMAGVFMISTATIAWRTSVLPRWLAVLGVVLAVVLLSVAGGVELALLAFPAWVLLVSTHLLLASRRVRR